MTYMRLAIWLLILLPLVPLSTVNGQSVNQSSFLRTPANYNPQTGAFSLSVQAYSTRGYEYGPLCIAYEYFIFNATGGQAVSWQVNSPGQLILYTVMSVDQYASFANNAQNCVINLSSPPGEFNSRTTLDWTPPATGQYVLVFYTRTFYGGPVYLTQ